MTLIAIDTETPVDWIICDSPPPTVTHVGAGRIFLVATLILGSWLTQRGRTAPRHGEPSESP